MNQRVTAPESIIPDAAMVAEYLERHPDFFEQHLELLTRLQVPHPSGVATSLVERQLQMLREQNRQLHSKLNELVAVARNNDGLAKRMQSLALSLLEADDLDEMLTGTQCLLREEFGADAVVLRLAASTRQQSLNDNSAFIDPDRLAPFASLLHSGKPRCGRLTSEQYRCLFDSGTAAIASTALVPLRGTDWQGLLAIGSNDDQRFHPGMGTLFLQRIGELLSTALGPYLFPLQPAASV